MLFDIQISLVSSLCFTGPSPLIPRCVNRFQTAVFILLSFSSNIFLFLQHKEQSFLIVLILKTARMSHKISRVRELISAPLAKSTLNKAIGLSRTALSRYSSPSGFLGKTILAPFSPRQSTLFLIYTVSLPRISVGPTKTCKND